MLGQCLRGRKKTPAKIGILLAGVVADGHIEGGCPLSYRPPDPSQSKNAQACAANLARPGIAALQPIAALDKTLGAANLPGRRQQQPDRQIGNVIGQHPRRMRDAHTLSPCGQHIHPLVAHTKYGNQF
ncbi:hypothetical protein D3C73_1117160 [compost metagenome]